MSNTNENENGRGRGGRGRGRGEGGRGRGEGGRGRGRGEGRAEVPGHRVFIGNLPNDTTSGDVKKLVDQFGKINDIYVLKQGSEAIVTFDKNDDATYAISHLSSIKYKDDSLVVNWARPKKQFDNKQEKEEKVEGDTKDKKEDKVVEKKKEEEPARPRFSEMQKTKPAGSPAQEQKAKPNNKKPENKPNVSQQNKEKSAKVNSSGVAVDSNNNKNQKHAEEKALPQKSVQEKPAEKTVSEKSTDEKPTPAEKSARYEINLRDIKSKKSKTTLHSVSDEEVQKLLKTIIPKYEVIVRNSETGEEVMYQLTDFHVKNNFSELEEASKSQFGL